VSTVKKRDETKDDKASSALIGTLGRVRIVYQPGQTGPKSVQYMSKAGFDRLQELVGAYAGLVDTRAKLAARPERKVRFQASKLLGLPEPEPIEETLPTPHNFDVYEVRGLRKKEGSKRSRGVILIPLHIKEVSFVDTVAVEN
jgi:hypothetical protein